MKKLLLIAAILASCASTALTQSPQPSKVEKSEDLGEYQKVNYVRQNATFNNVEYQEAYLIDGFQFFFSPQATVIIPPDNKEIYSNYTNSDSWASYPTFYFHRNKNHPFIISVKTGAEQYWGSTIYVIDKDYKCTLAGYLDLAPATDDYMDGEYGNIETVLRLKDQGKKGIRFTFACDSLVSMPAGDDRFVNVFSSSDIYFTYVNDTLVPSSKWNKLPGVQRAKLFYSIDKPASSVHFLDVNKDGQEDMVYVLRFREYTAFDKNSQKKIQRKDGTSIVVCLCKNRIIKEELIFDFDEPVDVEYEYRGDGAILVRKYNPGFQGKTETATFYRLDGKELVEIIG